MRLPAFGLPVLALVLALPIQAGSRQERHTFKLKAGGNLQVSTRNSSIQVTGWDKEEVSLVADISDTEKRPIQLKLSPGNGDRVEIEAIFPEGGWSGIHFGRGLACDLTLQVPKRLVGSFHTSNARIDARSTGGTLVFRTSNGRIELAGLSGEVEARTSNAKVEVRNLEGDLRGATSNGGLELEGVSGSIDFVTSNGGIRVSGLGGKGKGIQLRTSNGSVDVELGKATGEIHARTSRHEKIKVERQGLELIDMSRSNDVRLRLPGSNQIIDLATSNGGITLR